MSRLPVPLSGAEPPTRPLKTEHGQPGTLKTEPGKPAKLKAKPVPPPKPEGPWFHRLRWWIGRHRILSAAMALVLVLTGLGGIYVGYLFSSVPTPAELALPESTTVYYADGSTPMAKLGSENRTLLTYDEMNDAVREAIVAAEDQTFWTNEGIDFKGVLRAAWNNFTGGELQGASTITQQYARVAADLSGVTYSRKLKEAVMAWKLSDKYEKKQILEFYLNTVPFGRGAYGIEAAAQAYLGKTANRNAPAAQQVTMAEAMVLVAMVKQPNPNPDNPDGEPGYDPTRSEIALENSKGRWEYVRQGLVATAAVTPAEAAALVYPDTVVPWDPAAHTSGMDAPTGLVVSHALSELRQTDQFKDKTNEYIQNGGFRIITTIDPRAQAAAQKAADIRQDGTPAALRGQPANWRAALVAVEPGTGRVLAYYGGENGIGADYAGWYFEEDGTAVGFGAAPAGLDVQGLRPGRGAAAEHLVGVRLGCAAVQGVSQQWPRQRLPGRAGAQRGHRGLPAQLHPHRGHRRLAERAVLRPDRATRHGERHRDGGQGRHRLDVGQRGRPVQPGTDRSAWQARP